MGRRIIATTGIALLLFTGVVACGGDDDGGGGSPFGGGGGDGGDSGDIGDVGDIPGLSDECEAAYNLIMAMSMAMSGTGGDANEAFDQARDGVPDELKDDVEVIADAYGPYLVKVAEFEDPTAAYSDPEVVALAETLNTPEVVEASDNLNEYLNNTECG